MAKIPNNRRISERIDARIQVQFRTGAEFVNSYTQNISKGGLYLEMEVLPDPNALIEIVLKVSHFTPTISKDLTLKARVVRLMSVSLDNKIIHKVALQFVEISLETQLQLDALFAQLQEATPTLK